MSSSTSSLAEPEHEIRFPSILEGMNGIENKHYGHQVRSGSPSSSTAASTTSNEPVLDPLILQGLRVVKDRILLLRSDMELEIFLKDTSATRLRIVPPAFPPSLNSFQRLLVHRLADMWAVARELEQAPSSTGPAPPGNATGSALSAVMVLVKTPQSAIPAIRITSLIPEESESTPIQQPMVLALTHSNVDALPKAGPPQIPVLEQSSLGSPDSFHLSTTADVTTSAIDSLEPINPVLVSSSPALGQYRIMARSVPPSATSSSATSTSRDGETRSSSTSPTSRMSGSSSTMTFEQREAKYMEARLRIFSQGGESEQAVASPLPTSARAYAAPQQQLPAQAYMSPEQYGVAQTGAMPQDQPGQVMYAEQTMYQDVNGGRLFVPQPLRPSAPAFVYPATQAHMPHQQPPYQQSSGPSQQGSITFAPLVLSPGPAPFAGQILPSQLATQAAYPPQFQLQTFGSPELQQMAPAPGLSQHSRPTSSHSHSSHSSLSTTTSASSIRTASTSSARHKLRGQGTIDMRPMRQSSVAIPGPAGRQRSRPTLSNASSVSGTSLPSAGSASKGRSLPRFQPSMSPSEDLASETSSLSHAPLSQKALTSSRGSTSTSPSRSTSYSLSETASSSVSLRDDSSEGNSRAPSQGRSSRTSSPERSSNESVLAKLSLQDTDSVSADSQSADADAADRLHDGGSSKGKERAHIEVAASSKAGLPERPEWAVRKGRTRHSSEKQETHEAANAEEPAKDSSTTSKVSAPDVHGAYAEQSPMHEEREAAYTPVPPSSSAHMAKSPSGNPAEASAKNNSQAKAQPKILELTPLRYDPGKGWAALNTPRSAGGPNIANGSHANKPPRQSNDTGHRYPAQMAQSAVPGFQSSQNVPHLMQSGAGPQPVPGNQHTSPPSFGPPPVQQYYVQMPYVQSAPPNVAYGQQVFYAQPGPAVHQPQLQQMPQQFMYNPEHGGTYYMQSNNQQPQFYAGPQGPHFQQDASAQNAMPYSSFMGQPQPVKMIPMQGPVSHPGYSGAMTAADIIATGEMLYSYDIPRPVPRSGATLFDPNATSAR